MIYEIEELKKQDQELTEAINRLTEKRAYIRKVITIKSVNKKMLDIKRRENENKGTN